MRAIIYTLTLSVCIFTNVYAQDDSVFGTVSVKFQPNQVQGETRGCSLVYIAIQADHTYLNGTPIVINGNISMAQFGSRVAIQLKIGVKNLFGDNSFTRPHFAYLQTSNHSTAKVQSRVADGDSGYRLFFYSLSDPLVMSLYEELIDSGKVTIAFNRREKGLDVLVPIDLKVEDSEPVDGNLKRKISEDAIRGFLKCTVILMEQALSSTK